MQPLRITQTIKGNQDFLRDINNSRADSNYELLSDPADPNGTVSTLTDHGGPKIAPGHGTFAVYVNHPNPGEDDAFILNLISGGYYVSPDGEVDPPAGATFFGSIAASTLIPMPLTNDQHIQQFIDQGAAPGGNFPRLPADTLYIVIMPPGSTVTAGGQQSCQDFCGYHSKTTAGNYYAVICDTSCPGCHGNFTPTQARQMVISHEYGEWRSDPDGSGWYNDATGMENGDECDWILKQWGPALEYAVQPLAVNGRGCGDVPAYQAPQSPKPGPKPQPNGRQTADGGFALAITQAQAQAHNDPANAAWFTYLANTVIPWVQSLVDAQFPP